MVSRIDESNEIIKEEAGEWWEPSSQFFGKFYLEGDDSIEGFLKKKKLSLDERTQIEVNGVVNLLNLKGGESILDLPCGYGRHSIELAKKGFKVTGCDLNPTHLEKARRKAELANLEINWLLGNMLNVEITAKFDAIINMFYSFGFFENDKDNLQVLRNFYQNLKPGGQFLFHTDVNIPYLLSGEYKTYEERILSSGAKLIIRDEYHIETKRINGSWTILRGKDEVKKSYSVRVYDTEEFTDMCESVGFRETRCYSDWEKTPYSPKNEEMMIVAIK